MAQKIFLPKWTELVVALYNTSDEERYCGKLHRKTGITTRHLKEILVELEKRNFVSMQGNGKIKYIKLTEAGTKLAESFLRIYPTLKESYPPLAPLNLKR